jgi:hypothetical protein
MDQLVVYRELAAGDDAASSSANHGAIAGRILDGLRRDVAAAADLIARMEAGFRQLSDMHDLELVADGADEDARDELASMGLALKHIRRILALRAHAELSYQVAEAASAIDGYDGLAFPVGSDGYRSRVFRIAVDALSRHPGTKPRDVIRLLVSEQPAASLAAITAAVDEVFTALTAAGHYQAPAS